MRKTKLTILPSYKGRGFRLSGKEEFIIESLPPYIEEIISHWIKHYDEMIENKESTYSIDRFYLLGKKISEELREYLPQLYVTHASKEEIICQVGEDFLAQAKIYEALGEEMKAIEFYERRLKLDENNFDYLFDLGLALIKNEIFSRAATILEKAFEIKKDPDISFMIAICWESQNEHIKAKSYYLYALIHGEPSEELIMSTAINYAHLQEYDSAIELLNQGISIYPDNYEMLRGLVVIYNLTNDYENEILILKRLCELKPYDKENFIALGNSYILRGKFHQAINEFKEVLRLDPNFGLYYFKIAQLYHLLLMENFVIDWYLKALLKNPDFTKYFWEEGNFLLDLKVDESLKKELILFGAKSGDKSAQGFLAKENQSYVWE